LPFSDYFSLLSVYDDLQAVICRFQNGMAKIPAIPDKENTLEVMRGRLSADPNVRVCCRKERQAVNFAVK